ncbi:hypothetical protein GIB67_028043 [Kingdonia uniflora]|uniref:Uncharacterized protein n=1 Tax=Kingdonia uniflora TaxID=39325 RepID=A0A7J7KY02_9MAGN|nr:hypothetical protein GIB67_028043 [Kingdonia uniflora]
MAYRDYNTIKGAWTLKEDQKLSEYIKDHGAKTWKIVATKTGLSRSPKSCRFRWLNYLRPNIKRGNMSDQEEDLILRLHKLIGNRWSLIAGRLPGRTDNEIKNYWNSHLTKRVGHPIANETLNFSSYPRLKAWEKGNMKKINDRAANLFTLVKYHIDHWTIESINLQPWADSAVSGLDDVQAATLLSRKRMPLQVLNGNYEYYLEDRCWRQLTGTTGIPLDPPLNISPHLSLPIDRFPEDGEYRYVRTHCTWGWYYTYGSYINRGS